jgi:hypothetical protein
MSFKSICDLCIFCPVNINRTMNVEELYKVISDKVDFENIVPMAITLCQRVEQIPNLSGKEKLDLVMGTLRYALRVAPVGLEQKREIMEKLDTIVPLVIQAAILASKHPIVHKLMGCCGK